MRVLLVTTLAIFVLSGCQVARVRIFGSGRRWRGAAARPAGRVVRVRILGGE